MPDRAWVVFAFAVPPVVRLAAANPCESLHRTDDRSWPERDVLDALRFVDHVVAVRNRGADRATGNQVASDLNRHVLWRVALGLALGADGDVLAALVGAVVLGEAERHSRRDEWLHPCPELLAF